MLPQMSQAVLVALQLAGLPLLCLYCGSLALPTLGIRVATSQVNASITAPVITGLSRYDVQGLTKPQLSSFRMQVTATAKLPGTLVSRRQMQALMVSRHNYGNLLFSSMRGARKGDVGAQPCEVMQLDDIYGSEYAGELEIGTSSGLPLARLRVIYDTGSTDLWVLSDLCTKAPCTNEGRHAFNHTKSETFKDPNQPWLLKTTYGSGELRGQVGFDKVNVGPLAVRDQMIGLIADEVGDAFESFSFDGLVGLGFPSLGSASKLGAASFIDNLISQERLPLPWFAFYLHSDPTKGGAVLWGGIDERLYHAPLRWFPVAEERYWTLNLASFRIGDVSFDFGRSQNMVRGNHNNGFVRRRLHAVPKPLLIVDTGTTFFTAPSYMYRAFKHKISETYCSGIKALPSMVFGVVDDSDKVQEISVSPSEYMVKSEIVDGVCMPGLLEMDVDRQETPFMIIGEVFMRHFFTVFSRGTQGTVSRVGLARSREDDGSEKFFAEARS